MRLLGISLKKKYHVFYSVRWFEVKKEKELTVKSDFIVFDLLLVLLPSR